MTDNLLKNTTIYALGDIIPKGLAFIIFPILTNYLSPADYGIVNYINTINFFLIIVGVLCLNTYYMVYYYRVESVLEQEKMFGNLSIFVVGINLFFTFLIYGVGALFPRVFSENIDFFPYIAIGIVTNFFNVLAILPSALYRVQERPLPLTILNVSKGVLTMGFTVVLVVGYGFTALGVLYSTLIVSVIFGIIFSWITLKNMIWNIDFVQIKKALIFSLPLLPGALAYYFISMSDRVFIERYLDLTQLGIYSTASTLAMILNIIAYGAYKAFEPYFFKIYGMDGFKEKFIKVQNVFCAVVLLVGMGLSLFAKEFFVLFASVQYQTVYYFVPLVEIGVVFSAVSMLYGTIITAKGKTKINSYITIVGSLLSIALNVILLPIWGIVAACLASATSLGLILLLSIYYAKLEIGLFRIFLAFVVSVIIVGVSVYIFTFNDLWVSIGTKSIMLGGGIFAIFKILQFRWSEIIQSMRCKSVLF